MAATKLKLVRTISDLPPDCYRLSTDGRKWKSLCEARLRLATWLAQKADPDGTRIYPGIQKMMAVTKWSHGKVCYVLDDLREIGCIVNEGKLVKRGGQVAENGTALRRFDPTPLLTAHAAIKRNESFIHPDTRQSRLQPDRPRKQSEVRDSGPEVQDSQKPEIQGSKPEIQHSEQESKIGDLKSNAGLDATVLSDRPNIPPPPTERKKSVAAVEYFLERYGQVTSGNPLPIPLTDEEDSQIQSLEDQHGKTLYGKVCRYWTEHRELGGMQRVGHFFLKEFDQYLSIVRDMGKSNRETQAAMDADRARRLKEIELEKEAAHKQREFEEANRDVI